MGQMMTLTERNNQLQDLRTKLAWLRTEQLAVEQTIRQINREYRTQQLFAKEDLFTQMFT